MRVDGRDEIVGAALSEARRRGLYAIVRLQDAVERRIVVGSGGVQHWRSERRRGLGLHVFTPDGSAGFASTDDLGLAAVRQAVERAGSLADVARSLDGERTLAPFALAGQGRRCLPAGYRPLAETDEAAQVSGIVQAQEQARLAVGDLRVRTTHLVVDEEWRIARSDGTDLSFATPRAMLSHDLSGRTEGAAIRCSAAFGGADADATLNQRAAVVLARRAALAVRHAEDAAGAPEPPPGPCRLVLDYHFGKGLAHEAIGHLCESDVDGSVLMHDGRLRLGERLARPTVSVIDGPLAGDFAVQPVSANGIERQTVALIEGGVLAVGLGDLYSAERAGLPITGACRAADFGDRPTPRMTNTRIAVSDAAPLAADSEDMTPEVVADTIWSLGLLDTKHPTLYLTGYRGGQVQSRRGDIVFGAGAVYELSKGAAPCQGASFSGLAERAGGDPGRRRAAPHRLNRLLRQERQQRHEQRRLACAARPRRRPGLRHRGSAMIEAERLLSWLDGRPVSGKVQVVGWRVEVARSETLRVGVRASRLGGPYEAPGHASRLSGSLDLHWSDGRLTRTQLDREQIGDPEAALANWVAEATPRIRLPSLAGPATPPAVQAYDPDLARAVEREPRALLDLVRPELGGASLARRPRLDATMRAMAGSRAVATSAGFRCAWDDTAHSLDAWIDEAARARFGLRRLPTEAEIASLYGDALGQAASLRQDTPLPATSRGVLLMPAAVDAILSTYLRPHLIGRSIREGTSIFSMDDLARRRLVLPEHLDVLVDTTLPYALATAPCSSDGVPAGRAVLIAGGRLMSPLLDPATAAKMGLPPTPSPRGAPHLLLRTSTPTLSLGSALAAQADGVIVRGLPGLHTQRVGRRDYALVVPDAQAVVGGRAAGRCAVRIGGNPFEQLRSPSTRLVAVPGEWNPGLLVFDGVRIEPA